MITLTIIFTVLFVVGLGLVLRRMRGDLKRDSLQEHYFEDFPK